MITQSTRIVGVFREEKTLEMFHLVSRPVPANIVWVNRDGITNRQQIFHPGWKILRINSVFDNDGVCTCGNEKDREFRT